MTMDCGNSFPKQEVRLGGGTTKPMHVVVTESMSVFNQRALVSHGQESRAPHVSNQQQSPHQNAASVLDFLLPIVPQTFLDRGEAATEMVDAFKSLFSSSMASTEVHVNKPQTAQ